ncbi:MAG: tRNA (adenosine(37)-N6)-dimethylallyltransferase MiaA [Bacteroidota bacterium]|nr:tRNA (adenosine(37)-N6)-dimethylallyltransferase MiaA [Odoribacter sp.]MDP3644868.1 tRNA (adenosine(37)-N6)-dimethylallyltransferase MiaA [Bacteroidota bacterium]
MTDKKYNLITILGPTASGKTSVAAKVASVLDGEVISADSRQVYRGMDLGTGKDYGDYVVDGKVVPCHLIDIVDAGYEYNVYEYQKDFLRVFAEITERGKLPIMCGGSGLYLESILKNYKLIQVPVNEKLRAELDDKLLWELTEILRSYKNYLHNQTDTESSKRAIRAIEIEEYYLTHPEIDTGMPEIRSLVVGVKFDRDSRRKRITSRLKQRLKEGMLDEVMRLLDSGLTLEQLTYYGLEYKYMTQHLTGQLTYQQMFDGLNVAIHQFAKRQMTWFRRMEIQGTEINWLDGYMPLDEKVEKILGWYSGEN